MIAERTAESAHDVSMRLVAIHFFIRNTEHMTNKSTDNQKIFYYLLANSLVSTVTNAFAWFAVTFWVFLETRSVLATSLIAGIFSVANAGSAFIFGSIVDHNKKKTVMVYSNICSLAAYLLASAIYFFQDASVFTDVRSTTLWAFVVVLMLGSVVGNLRTIALTTTVTLLFPEDRRDRANGMIGTMNGISFSLTSIFSGLVIGFLGMSYALLFAVAGMALTLLHLFFISIPEKEIVTSGASESAGRIDVRGTMAAIQAIPGLLALIFFTTFNNFLGGVFMALMDAYGLSLVTVQQWGLMWGVLSLAFIIGGVLIAKFGLGKNPLSTMFKINIITWTVCIFFTIQASIVLLGIGMFIWMILMPFVEASEHTVIQKVVPYDRQGRVFGFAQSVEMAASPITTFLIGPIAQFIFIPFMTTGAGVELFGNWFGTGMNRGIALVFIAAGVVGLCTTLLARRSRAYRILSERYVQAAPETSPART